MTIALSLLFKQIPVPFKKRKEISGRISSLFSAVLTALHNKVAKKPDRSRRSKTKENEMSKKMKKVLVLAIGLTVLGIALVAMSSSDKKEPRHNGDWCDTPNILEKIRKQKWSRMHTESAKIQARQRMSANQLCMQFPEEEACKAWKERIECENDEECFDDMDDGMYISESDVTECFVSPDSELSKDDLEWLPSSCLDFQSFSVQNLKKSEKLSQFRVTEMPKGVEKWANKVTPGHVSGIAGGALLIMEQNEELADFDPDLNEFLKTIAEVGSSNKADYEQSAGITVGLYNTLLTMIDQHMQNVRTKNAQLCASYKGRDLVPARCLLTQAE